MPSSPPREKQRLLPISLAVFLIITALSGCEKQTPPPKAPQALPASVLSIEPQDTPIVFEFVGQTESSRQVEIRARVEGFLDKIAYQEGALVQAGQVLFQMDPRPFQADLQQARGELALQQAQLETSVANLSRVRPLAAQRALSQKDLDDAVGSEKSARAAVLAAEGAVRSAELNLSYTTIKSPVTGLASRTEKQEGSFVSPGAESLLTYVAQLDPMWVNFSVSENQLLSGRQEEEAGRIQPPAGENYDVEVVFADGSSHPQRGHVNFAEPNVDPETGTLLIRAELGNPAGSMRPGQFVRARLHGAIRPGAILVPQDAVMQGAKGHFVWVVNDQGQAEVRAIEVGPWHGDQWFIDQGLQAGDRVVVDNLLKLSQGMPIQASAPKQKKAPAQSEKSDGERPQAGGSSKEADLEQRLKKLENRLEELAREKSDLAAQGQTSASTNRDQE